MTFRKSVRGYVFTTLRNLRNFLDMPFFIKRLENFSNDCYQVFVIFIQKFYQFKRGHFRGLQYLIL